MKNMWRENVPMITRLICGVSITVDFNRPMDISVIQWQIAPDYHIIVTYNNMTVIPTCLGLSNLWVGIRTV